MERKNFSKLAKQIRGVSYKPEDLHENLDENSVTLLRANNIFDGKINFDDVVYVDKSKVTREQYLCKGDILVCASSGSKQLVGKAASFNFDIECTFGAFCKVVRPNQDVANYLSVYFQSNAYRRKISEVAIGANINNIRNEHIDALELPIGSNAENEKVVASFSLLQQIIDGRKQQLHKLDELVKARFVEMFGEPDKNTFAWNMTTVGALISSCDAGWSGNGTQREKKDGEIAVLKVSAVTKGYFIPDECKVLDNQNNIKKYIFPQAGDLLFSRANTREMVGATAVITQDYPEYILPDKLWKIRFVEAANVWYMKYILSSETIRSVFSSVSTGTSGSMFNVSMEKFKSIMIPLPPLELQQQFATFVEQTDKSKAAAQKALDEAQLLFDSLMQQYFS